MPWRSRVESDHLYDCYELYYSEILRWYMVLHVWKVDTENEWEDEHHRLPSCWQITWLDN